MSKVAGELSCLVVVHMRRGLLKRFGLSRLCGAVAFFGVLLVVSGSVVGSAFGAQTRVPVEAFGPDGTSASSFGWVYGLAFDQGDKRLYALDQEAQKVYGFDESRPGAHGSVAGFPVHAEESEEGYFDSVAAGGSSHQVYYASNYEEKVFGFGEDGSELVLGFPLSVSGVCGATVDPAGNLWVASYVSETVHEFSSAGASIATVNTSAQGLPCNVAFDAEDNLYVSMYHKGVWRYTATSGYTEATEVSTGAGGVGLLASLPIAVDRSTGDLYVVYPDHVVVFSGSGELLYEFGGSVAGAEYSGIAVDEATDRVYVSDDGAQQVRVFGAPVPLPTVATGEVTGTTDHAVIFHGTVSPEGEALTGCVFEYGTGTAYGSSVPCVPGYGSIEPDAQALAVSGELASGLSANTTYHFRVSVSTVKGTSNGRDRTFTTAIGAPTVGGESVQSVGGTDAIVTANIDPKGSATTYIVEYGQSNSYGQASGVSGPLGTGGDDTQHPVSVHLEGLTAGAEYHFRFVATNAVAQGVGGDGSFVTFSIPQAFPPGSCPLNEAFRTGAGSDLPDCRAYEQVSPADKLGGSVLWGSQVVQASNDGDRVTFDDNSDLPTSGGSSATNAPQFIASRGAGGWETDGLQPATEPGVFSEVLGISNELTGSVSEVQGNAAPGLYLRDSATGSESRVVAHLVAAKNSAAVAGFASDPANLLFESDVALIAGAVANAQNLYELDDGVLGLVGMVPTYPATSCSGEECVASSTGAFAGPYAWQLSRLSEGGAMADLLTTDTISSDGSRVFFTQDGTGRLYLREHENTTIQVSAPEAGVTDPNGEKAAAFAAATPTGSVAFFTSCQKLTADATAVSTAAERTCSDISKQGQDLYTYDTGSGRLTDLTVDDSDSYGAQVVGVVGASSDGANVYFAANGVLAAGAAPGNCTISSVQTGSCSLYLAHIQAGGVSSISFVARVESGENDWSPNAKHRENLRASRVSAGGAILFTSVEQLTAYDNHGYAEYYRYAPADAVVSCVSCDPTGTAPVGAASLQPLSTLSALVPEDFGQNLTHNISGNGNRVFFETPDKLVAADTNGDAGCPKVGIEVEGGKQPACIDVYEWEAAGEGSCTETAGAYSAQDEGCLYLISTGTSTAPSFFGDADENGENVFFFTEQQLVPQDQDQLYDVYDARVEGGLTVQYPSEPVVCAGEGCRGAASPAPVQPVAESSVLDAPGNVVFSNAVKHKAVQRKKAKKKHKPKKPKRKQRHKGRKSTRGTGREGGGHR